MLTESRIDPLYGRKRKTAAMVAGILAMLITCTIGGWAQNAYTVTFLPTDGLTDVYTMTATLINNSNVVVGYWYKASNTGFSGWRGFIWYPDDPTCGGGPGTCVHDIGPNAPDGMSDGPNPVVTMIPQGSAPFDAAHPCHAWKGGTSTPIPYPGCAIGVNTEGNFLVGADGLGHFASWNFPGLALAIYSHPAGGGAFYAASDVGSNRIGYGAVGVGCCILTTFNLETLQVVVPNILSSLPTPYGGVNANNSINTHGQIIGSNAYNAPYSYGGFLYDPVAGVTAIPTLGTSPAYPNGSGFPNGLNNLGQVVGQSAETGTGEGHAYRYDSSTGTLVDLNPLTNLQRPTFTLVAGNSINDNGWIVVDAFNTGPVRLAALLRPKPIPITVETVPSGLNIMVDGATAAAPQNYTWLIGSHSLSTADPQQENGGSRLKFVNWSNGGARSHTVPTPGTATTYTASFQNQYLLTTVSSPASGGGITPGGWFNSSASVVITATPSAGYVFAGFSGDLSGTNNPQTLVMSGPRTVTANFKAVTSTTLGTAPNPSTYGQAVTMTAVVSSNSGTPTGTVVFYDGPANIGTAALNAAGQASLNALFPPGSHSITTVYGGNDNFSSSTSAAVLQTVNQAASSTTVTSSANPSLAGQTVTFNAMVSSPAGIPTGTVTFMDGTATIGAGALNASGQASFTTSALAVGSHSITAAYGGDLNFLGSSSSALSQIVNQARTSITLSVIPNPSFLHQVVSFTAIVASSGGGIPSGLVRFTDEGLIAVATAMLDSSGKATVMISTLSVGSHSMRAIYAGNAGYMGSMSPVVNQVVTLLQTTTSLDSSPNPSLAGQVVTFTALVSSSQTGTPAGTVAFREVLNDGSRVLGTGAVDAAGHARFAISTLTKGSHRIIAVYGGDPNFAGSTSSAVIQTVN